MRSTSSSSKPASSSRSAALPRTSPCAHGQALIPVASTPTTRRARSAEAAAIPISETISWVRMRVTGVSRCDRVPRGRPRPRRAGRAGGPTTCARDVLGELLDEQRLADHELVDRLLEQLRKARHVHAALRGVEVDRAGDLGGDELLVRRRGAGGSPCSRRGRRRATGRSAPRATEDWRSVGEQVRALHLCCKRTKGGMCRKNQASPSSSASRATTCARRSRPSSASRARSRAARDSTRPSSATRR